MKRQTFSRCTNPRRIRVEGVAVCMPAGPNTVGGLLAYTPNPFARTPNANTNQIRPPHLHGKEPGRVRRVSLFHYLGLG